MLYEEQAAELLKRCEALAGRRLVQVRGNLQRASTRAEAVWELLVLEAASHLGKVECEGPAGGPDIRLLMPSGRWLAIEVTYLHPRFEEDEVQCNAVVRWIAEKERLFERPRIALSCSFDGGRHEASGTRLTLPEEHEKRKFLESPELVQFLSNVRERPTERHSVKLAHYTVQITSRPRLTEGDIFSTSSRPALDSPGHVREHAAFRALRAKIAQHAVDGPYIVCIGSDVSRVIPSREQPFGGPRVRDAVAAATRQTERLSAALIVPIETKTQLLQTGVERHAKPMLYPITECRHPLTESEVRVLGSLNLNHWKYTFPLARREPAQRHRQTKLSRNVQLSFTNRGTMKMTVPASILVDALAGRTNLLEEFADGDG
ncbi:MAG: hypothetical protein IV105_06125 [Rhizobacter sp.]|nr:hypothetical protein [Rhizobacter sp.]